MFLPIKGLSILEFIAENERRFLLINIIKAVIPLNYFQNDAVPGPEVPLAILKYRLKKATSPREILEIRMKIMDLLKVCSDE